jgi:ribosome biogenesis GTPase / thiamine phosphate phosphatase
MPKGLVVRSTGSRYMVRAGDASLHECVAKGRLRTKGWNSTNPVAVGDHVEFDPQLSPDLPGSITDLHDRRNYLVRRSVNLSHHKHVIAANLDQLLLIATVARPRTSFGFIDRFLVTAEAYEVPAVLLLNKVDDLRGEEELDLLALYQEVYEEAGYRTLITSALTGVGVDQVKELLHGRVTLVAGHSGVGKSTLINAIQPDLDLFTLEVSESSEKGQHTTTNAEMYELDTKGWPIPGTEKGRQAPGGGPSFFHFEGTFLIDTPGVKGFGLVDMRPEHIGDQFPEMFRLKDRCRFNNCMHRNEPGCAIRDAVAAGTIAESRYASYLDMVLGIDDETSYRTE